MEKDFMKSLSHLLQISVGSV